MMICAFPGQIRNIYWIVQSRPPHLDIHLHSIPYGIWTIIILSGIAEGTRASIQRILNLLWEATLFFHAASNSFRAIMDDPAGDIASRAAIPAHVKALLGEAVVEINELKRERESNPSLQATIPSTPLPLHQCLDQTSAKRRRKRYAMPMLCYIAFAKLFMRCLQTNHILERYGWTVIC